MLPLLNFQLNMALYNLKMIEFCFYLHLFYVLPNVFGNRVVKRLCNMLIVMFKIHFQRNKERVRPTAAGGVVSGYLLSCPAMSERAEMLELIKSAIKCLYISKQLDKQMERFIFNVMRPLRKGLIL